MSYNRKELKVKYDGDGKLPKKKRKNPNTAEVSRMGYRDDSPYRSMPYIDIHTPDGTIDMSSTGIPLWANGRILPPYSGIHQFDTTQVKEIPLAQGGGENYNMQRAEKLYTPDETGHWPSIDYETGEWLKSKEHPTAWMEYLYGHTLNPQQALNYDVRVKPEGYFGENTLQYVPKQKKGGWLGKYQKQGEVKLRRYIPGASNNKIYKILEPQRDRVRFDENNVYIDTKGKKPMPAADWIKKVVAEEDSSNTRLFTRRALGILSDLEKGWLTPAEAQENILGETWLLKKLSSDIKPVGYKTYDKNGTRIRIPIYKEPDSVTKNKRISSSYYPQKDMVDNMIEGFWSGIGAVADRLPDMTIDASLISKWFEKLTSEGPSFLFSDSPETPKPKPPTPKKDKNEKVVTPKNPPPTSKDKKPTIIKSDGSITRRIEPVPVPVREDVLPINIRELKQIPTNYDNIELAKPTIAPAPEFVGFTAAGYPMVDTDRNSPTFGKTITVPEGYSIITDDKGIRRLSESERNYRLNKKQEGGWLKEYQVGGPKTKKPSKYRVTASDIEAADINEQSQNYYNPDDFYYSDFEYDKDKQSIAERVNLCKTNGEGCLSTANYWYNKWVAPKIGNPSSWDELAYSGVQSTKENTYDSWDVHGLDNRTVLYNRNSYKDKYDAPKAENIWKELDLPIGAIIGYGEHGVNYLKPGEVSMNAKKGLPEAGHSGRIVAYDKDTGEPWVFDSVNGLRRISKNTHSPISVISVDNRVLGNTYSNMQKGKNAYVSGKATPIEIQWDDFIDEDGDVVSFDEDEFNPFMQAFINNKPKWQGLLGLDDKTYNEYARIAGALAISESEGGNDNSWRMDYGIPLPGYTLDKMGWTNSSGITQLNKDTVNNLYKKHEDKFKRYGLFMNQKDRRLSGRTGRLYDFNNPSPQDAAFITMLLLKDNKPYAESLYKKGKTNNPNLTDAEKQWYAWNQQSTLLKGEAQGDATMLKKFRDAYNKIRVTEGKQPKLAEKRTGGSIGWLKRYQPGGDTDGSSPISPFDDPNYMRDKIQQVRDEFGTPTRAYIDQYGNEIPYVNLPTVEITASRPEPEDTYMNYVLKNYSNYEDPTAGLLASMFLMPVDAVFGYPQAAATKLATGKYQLPSEAMGVENPVGSFLIDAFVDPTNVIGAGLFKNTVNRATAKNLFNFGVRKTIEQEGLAALSNPSLSFMKKTGYGASRFFFNISRAVKNKPLKDHFLGIGAGLKDVTEGRPWLETFPITKAQKAKVYAKQDVAFKEGEDFVRRWFYDPMMIDQRIRQGVHDKMQWAADATGQTFKYPPSAMNLDNPDNPLKKSSGKLINTRRAELLKQAKADPNINVDAIKQQRGIASGFVQGDKNYTARNFGMYAVDPKRIKHTAAHELAHIAQKHIGYRFSKPDDILMGTGFSGLFEKWDPNVTPYAFANPDTPYGIVFGEAMTDPKLFSDLRKKTMEKFFPGGKGAYVEDLLANNPGFKEEIEKAFPGETYNDVFVKLFINGKTATPDNPGLDIWNKTYDKWKKDVDYDNYEKRYKKFEDEWTKRKVELKDKYKTWEASPMEVHSELMVARMKLADELYMQGNGTVSYEQVLAALRNPNDEIADKLLRIMAERPSNKFFKPQTSLETKRNLLRMLPAFGGAGFIYGASEMGPPPETEMYKKGGSKLPPHLPEAYKTGGWLKKYE